jgi:hypothetical protein
MSETHTSDSPKVAKLQMLDKHRGARGGGIVSATPSSTLIWPTVDNHKQYLYGVYLCVNMQKKMVLLGHPAPILILILLYLF